MVWSSLAPKWPIPVPFCGMDHEKSNFLLISESDTLSIRGCWGQPISFFWKLFDETQISEPPATRHHKSKIILVLLSLRANSENKFQCETPCTYMSFCQTFYYTYIFFHFQTFHQCTVNNFKPTPFLFQAQPPIPVEGWLDHWPLLVIPTTIWAEVHLLPEIKVPITVRLVSKEDQDAVRLWPLLQGTVYELLLEV